MCIPVYTPSLLHLSSSLQKLQVASRSLFISLVQDRWIPETSTTVGQEARTCVCVRARRGTHPCYMSIANIAWSFGVIINSFFLSPPVITLTSSVKLLNLKLAPI